MQHNNGKQPVPPFKARLRHYHRTASPALYSRKERRWEEASASEFGGATRSPSKSHTKGKDSVKLTLQNKGGSPRR